MKPARKERTVKNAWADNADNNAVAEDINRALRALIDKSIGDYRESVGLPRAATKQEIEDSRYCTECGHRLDGEEEG